MSTEKTKSTTKKRAWKKLNPKEHTKADVMRHLLRQDQTLSYEDACRIYGRGFISKSQFSAVKYEVVHGKKPAYAHKTKKKATRRKATKKADKRQMTLPWRRTQPLQVSKMSDIETMQYENRYLRWALAGEQQGFFDRWLTEQEQEEGQR